MSIDTTQTFSYTLDKRTATYRVFVILSDFWQRLNRHAERRREERAVQTLPANMLRDLSIDRSVFMSARYAQPHWRG